MSHTPQQIADLARAALTALAERDRIEAGRPVFGAGNAARRAWWAKQEAYEQAVRDPATGLALCTRLRAMETLLDAHETACGFATCKAMTTPLTPKAEDAHP